MRNGCLEEKEYVGVQFYYGGLDLSYVDYLGIMSLVVKVGFVFQLQFFNQL